MYIYYVRTKTNSYQHIDATFFIISIFSKTVYFNKCKVEKIPSFKRDFCDSAKVCLKFRYILDWNSINWQKQIAFNLQNELKNQIKIVRGNFVILMCKYESVDESSPLTRYRCVSYLNIWHRKLKLVYIAKYDVKCVFGVFSQQVGTFNKSF